MQTTHAGEVHLGTQERASRAKGTRIAAWVATASFVAMMGASAILYLTGNPAALAALRQLGYPEYFRLLLGTAKLLGALALLMPRPSALREWAYAGFTFDLVAAVASHLLSGDSPAHAAPAVFALALVLASYGLRRRATALEAPAQ